MLPGLYTSAAGMLGQLDRQDAIAHNLANINTSGYKRQTVSFSSLLIQTQNATPADKTCIVPIPTLYQDGKASGMQDTGSRTDLALDGPGAFVVQAGSGERYVRGGSFRLDSTGQLVAGDGSPVLTDRGPVKITSANWSVDQDGNVIVDKAVAGKLRIQGASADPKHPTRVVQGSVEGSNVNAVEEMVSMITALRSYEACSKSIQSLDQTLDKLINQMGRA